MSKNFQREGSKSNAHVGREFEISAMKLLRRQGVGVERNHKLKIGVGRTKKEHSFDLGSSDPPTLVECKSHRWTSGGNVPSAKLTVWNEAMYYFSCNPRSYRKILFVLWDYRTRTRETLAQYYLRTYCHLIPRNVEIWEYNERSKRVRVHTP